jgi:adenosylhomocysteine nucleosidase
MKLVCFAVKEEANAFRKLATQGIEIVLTGIGRRNAEKAIRAALAVQKPELVISSGFAGGLRPDLKLGDIVFAADREINLEPVLLAAGGKPAKFHCVERIATTAAEKQALRQQTGADAVEMESETIRELCREQRIPIAIVRVILDTANEDLPLDFNKLLDADLRMDAGKLVWRLAKSPAKVVALLRLQKQSAASAEKLARTLADVLEPTP